MRDIIEAQGLFCSIVRHGSYFRGLSLSHVGEDRARKLLGKLEATLGMPLFEDLKSGKPTAFGFIRYKKWQPSLTQLRLLAPSGEETESEFRLAFPFTTGSAILAPLTAEFGRLFPGIKFDIHLASGSGLPVWHNMDLRVVHGEYIYEDVKEFLLTNVVRIACATPKWIEGNRIRRPKDLERCSVFGTRDAVERRIVTFKKEDSRETVIFNPQIICRNNFAALYCALTGAGAAVSIPRFLAQPYLDSGVLACILPSWRLTSLSLRAVLPNQRKTHPVLEQWVDFIRSRLKESGGNFE